MSSLFWNMCKRDLLVYSHRAKNIVLNEIIIRPFFFMFTFGYLMPRLSVRATGSSGIFFVGTIIYVCSSLAFGILFDFWLDIENPRFCSFQLTRLPSLVFLVQKILCASLVLFMALIPLYPCAQFFLNKPFPLLVLKNIPIIFSLLACIALFMITFVLCALLFIHHLQQIRFFWRRVMLILANLGGVFLPYAAFANVFPHASTLLYLNPFMYVTEGMRQALIGGDFFSLPVAFGGISVFTVIFFIISLGQLRRRMDPVG